MGKNRHRGNGQGTAIRRGAGWEARVVVGWKLNKDETRLFPIVKSKGGFSTKKEALEYCPTLRLSVEKPKEAPTLKYYWEVYQRDLNKISKDKQDAYWIAWRKMESIHFRKIDSLTVAELRDLVAEKTKSYYPAKDMRTVLKHLFNLGAADQWVNKDLPEFIVLPELEEAERIPFTKEEQELLWKSYENGNTDAAIPLIMIYTGMMTGEMKKLEPGMIDLEERKKDCAYSLIVPSSMGVRITPLYRQPVHISDMFRMQATSAETNVLSISAGLGLKTKVRKKAEVFLATSIIPVIEDLIAGKKGKIFPFGDTKFYNMYYGALEKAGVRKLSPYSCRHTTATALAIDKNIAPQTIKKVMRWSSTKMLDRYAHPEISDAVEAVEVIGKS